MSDLGGDEPAPASDSCTCPDCGHSMSPAGAALPNLLICTHCGRECFAHSGQEDAEDEPPELTESPSPAEAARAAELDGLRIRQLASLRRSTYRSRSYAIIGAVVCAVGVVQAGVSLWRQIQTVGWDRFALLYSLLIPPCIAGAGLCFRHAMHLHQELRRRRADAFPVEPIDFSSLGDGSRRWKNLDDLR